MLFARATVSQSLTTNVNALTKSTVQLFVVRMHTKLFKLSIFIYYKYINDQLWRQEISHVLQKAEI